MPVRSVGATHRAAHASQATESPEVRAALNWFSRNLSWINDQQVRMTEVPAPPFQESARADLVKSILADCGLQVSIDKTGNVIGELPGANDKEIVMLTAHLDTVFPPGTEVKVRRDGDRFNAPGISDNGIEASPASSRPLAQSTEAGIKPRRRFFSSSLTSEKKAKAIFAACARSSTHIARN